MNLRDIEYIVTVAELSSFGEAAKQCYVSQPTLSGQIKKLEEELGLKIFERTNRRVMVTPQGEEIIAHGKAVLQSAQQIRDIASNSKDPLGGTFKLGAFPTLASYFFPRIIPNIKTHLPNLRLMLVEEKTETLLEQLRAGDIDAAFLALPIDDHLLESQALFDDPFLLATPADHRLTEHDEITQSMLDNDVLLLLDEGHCLRDQALDVCQLHGLAEEKEFRATSLETLRAMVKAGSGITFMPRIAVPDETDKDIAYIPFTSPAPFRTIGLVWRKTSARKAVIEKLLEENMLAD